jgi:hypothetical protein
MISPNEMPQSGPLPYPERRHHPRYTVQVPIEFKVEGTDVPLRVETTDLSRGGCYVQMMMTLVLGTYIRATLWINDQPIRARGRVVTRHPQFGNGIMFIEFEGNGEQLLKEYLDAISL